jgi:hypothetical protein
MQVDIDSDALSMLVIAAVTSWIKSRVNSGADSANFSLRFTTNAMGSPEMNPASEDVRKVNIMKNASRTFTCNDRTFVVLEVVANCPKEGIRSDTEFLVVVINTK